MMLLFVFGGVNHFTPTSGECQFVLLFSNLVLHYGCVSVQITVPLLGTHKTCDVKC